MLFEKNTNTQMDVARIGAFTINTEQYANPVAVPRLEKVNGSVVSSFEGTERK